MLNHYLTKSLEVIRFQSYFFTIDFEPSTHITKPKML
mgnify:FL=1